MDGEASFVRSEARAVITEIAPIGSFRSGSRRFGAEVPTSAVDETRHITSLNAVKTALASNAAEVGLNVAKAAYLERPDVRCVRSGENPGIGRALHRRIDAKGLQVARKTAPLLPRPVQ